MIARPVILRCTAFLLILIFAQKSWAGLFLHNLLHSSNATKESPAKQEGQDMGFNYNCTCVDDFLIPFEATIEPVLSSPSSSIIIPLSFFENRLPFCTSFFSSLRGPPASRLL